MKLSTLFLRAAFVASAFACTAAACGSSVSQSAGTTSSTSSSSGKGGAGGDSTTCPPAVQLPPADDSCTGYQLGLTCSAGDQPPLTCVCKKDASGKKVWDCMSSTGSFTTGPGGGQGGAGGQGQGGAGGGGFLCNKMPCDPMTHYCRQDQIDNPTMPPSCVPLPANCKDCKCLQAMEPICHFCSGDTMKGISMGCGG